MKNNYYYYIALMKWTSIDKPPHLSKIKIIHLCNLELTILPNWISRCKNLRILNCNQNSLTKLPENLPQSLRILRFHSNSITHMPINLPENLKIINCANNLLTYLPENFTNSLVRLICSYNQLLNLPNNLPKSLTHLDFSYNNITSIPISIVNCINLSKFIDTSNPLINIDPAVLSFISNKTEWTLLDSDSDCINQ